MSVRLGQRQIMSRQVGPSLRVALCLECSGCTRIGERGSDTTSCSRGIEEDRRRLEVRLLPSTDATARTSMTVYRSGFQTVSIALTIGTGALRRRVRISATGTGICT